ncbi:response regulator transcription factor [Gudongella sp. DL1XJH-153]|uniref:response regulator transcription factor n=1 Tax=Gudongella sp. DL1XJH-153 TaxID=3409804 RepID=UPI003BB6DF52
MGNILVADDEMKMRRLIREYLISEGFTCFEAENGSDALEKFSEREYQAVLLDVMMPEVDGWTVLREIRKESSVPVIMLTARGEEYDRLFGFELGVDDYMVKPFSPKELMARLKAVIRRNSKDVEDEPKIFQLEGIEVDFEGRTVHMDGDAVKMTPKEYDLLVYLIENRNRALTRQQILDGVWGIDYFGEDRTVDTHIKMLRDRLKPYKHFFETVWGVGYKLETGEKKK